MSIRTAATILREMTQAKAASISENLKKQILMELEAELTHMYRHQATLPGIPPAEPPNPLGARGDKTKGS